MVLRDVPLLDEPVQHRIENGNGILAAAALLHLLCDFVAYIGFSDSSRSTTSGLVARLKKASNECPADSFAMGNYLEINIAQMNTPVNMINLKIIYLYFTHIIVMQVIQNHDGKSYFSVNRQLDNLDIYYYYTS